MLSRVGGAEILDSLNPTEWARLAMRTAEEGPEPRPGDVPLTLDQLGYPLSPEMVAVGIILDGLNRRLPR